MLRNSKGKRGISALAALLLLQLSMPFQALAQAAPGDIDLSSGDRNIAGNTIAGFSSAVIRVGGTTRTVTAADMLSAAEYTAVMQVLSGGRQTLNVGAGGFATGGHFDVSSTISQPVNNLVIPTGVTAIQNAANLSILNLTGSLINAGNFLALSTNGSSSSATINATDISNLVGSLLTSSATSVGPLPSEYAAAIQKVDLNLNALGDIVNSGRIQSSGSLTMSAGNSIINNQNSVVRALDNVNLVAPNLYNRGWVGSENGSINISSALPSSIYVDATGGTFHAVNGTINVRDGLFTGKYDTTLLGGNFLSTALNIFSGSGNVDINVGDVTGILNASGHNLHIMAASNALQLGTLTVTGDPIIENSAGDLIITNDLIVSGQPLVLKGSGSIITTPAVSFISTSFGSGGGDIIMLAGGFLLDVNGSPNFALKCGECRGGSIDFSASPGILIDTVAGVGNAGNLYMLATGGSHATGQIILPANSTIDTWSAGANAGNVLIVSKAEHISATTAAIQLGEVNVLSGNAGTGAITIATANPILSSTTLPHCPDCVEISPTGQLLAGNTIAAGDTHKGSIQVGNIIGQGGLINIRSAYNIQAGTINNAGNGAGGAVILENDSHQPFVLGGATSNSVQSIVTGDGTGNSGDVTIIAKGSGGIDYTSAGAIVTNATNGAGGDITVDTKAHLILPTGTINLSGVNGAGGTFRVTAPSIDVAGPVLINANASSGSAGSVQLKTTETNSSGDINISAGGLSITAIVTSGDGDAGSVTLESGRNVSVDTAAMTLSPGTNGKGGSFTATSGNALGGATVYVNGSLDLSGSGTGAGGSVSITSTSTDPFVVGPAAGNAGVAGMINVESGGTAGAAGGAVSIVTTRGPIIVADEIRAAGTGAGGSITLNAPWVDLSDPAALLNASGGQGGNTGDGGSISLIASGIGGVSLGSDYSALSFSPSTTGKGGSLTMVSSSWPLTLPTGTIDASGIGATGAGGTINLTAPSFNLTAGPVTLLASGSGTGTGNGGSVSLTTTNESSAADIDISASGFSIDTSAGSGGGNGGTVKIKSAAGLSVAMTELINLPSTNGNGGIFEFETTAANPRNFIIVGDIDASAVGNGNGGTVVIKANTDAALEFAVGAAQGVDGLISANGAGTGSGGSITIENKGRGNISLQPVISATAGTTGSGGTFSATAAQGAIEAFGIVPLAAAGTGNGGKFTLSAPNDRIEFGGANIDVSAVGSGLGGEISLLAQRYVLPGLMTLSADGAGTGNGGKITIVQTQPGLALSVGSTDWTLSAVSGNGATGNGGSLTVASGGNLEVTMAGVTADAISTSGNGATYSFEAGRALNGLSNFGNLLVIGDVVASATAGADGGSITLKSNSTDVFRVNQVSANGTTGQLVAQGTNAGSIAIHAGSGGIEADGVDLDARPGANGDGGKYELKTTGSMNISTMIDAGGSGPNGDGGKITLEASDFTNPSVIRLQAQGMKGGQVEITSKGPTSDLVFQSFFGPVTAGGFEALPIGAGSGQSGGTLKVSSGRSISVLGGFNAIALGSNSDGGTYQLTASTAAPGDIVIDIPGTSLNANAGASSGLGQGGTAGSITIVNLGGRVDIAGGLSANSSGPNPGGSITVISNSSEAFHTGDTSGNNGVSFLSARATSVNAERADGGSITVQNLGSGGIVVDDATLDLQVNSAFLGAGGSVSLAAPNGMLTFPTTSTINADAAGIVSGQPTCCNGGTITLLAEAITTDRVFLSVNASGNGNAGTVSITATGSTSDVRITQENFNIIGYGGDPFSNTGDGNALTLNVTAGGNIFADSGSIETGLLGPGSGKGAQITLTAVGGTVGTGNILVFGGLHADGFGTGDGGTITLNFNSNLPFLVGSNTTTSNGIRGSLTANGGTGVFGSAASGGTITLNSTGTGGVHLAYDVPGTPTISANAGDGGGFGGSINIQAANQLVLFEGGAIIQSDATCGNGANITITAKKLGNILGSTLGALTLMANAAGDFAGGTINITTSDTAYDIVIGTGNGQITVLAEGGESGSLGGAGGTLSLNSARGIRINNGGTNDGLAIGPRGVSGGGASYVLSAANGPLTILGDAIHSNAIGMGDGGTMKINLPTSTATLVQSATSKILLSANAGPGGGHGGTVEVTTNGQVTLTSGFNITANAVNAPGGSDAYNGGSIKLNVTQITGFLNRTISANGAGWGKGGQIDITLTGTTTTAVGLGNGQFSVQATGGNALSLAGDGGKISIATQGTLNVNPLGLNAGPLGLNGKGAEYNLSGATALFISSNLSANGAGRGDGGKITLGSGSASNFNILPNAAGNGVKGIITANGGAQGGKGGFVGITVLGTLAMSRGALSPLPTNNLIQANGTGFDGHGGEIVLNAATVTVPSTSTLLTANGSGNGNGGSISIITSGPGDIKLGTTTGRLQLQATGGSASSDRGHGGTVIVNSAAGFNMNSVNAIAVGPLGNNGNGGTIKIATGQQGNLLFDFNNAGTLSANGVGLGNGGVIEIVSGNPASAFTVGAGTALSSGLEGNIVATAGFFGTRGGSVSISAAGTGGIAVRSGTLIDVSAVNGRGGDISLTASFGRVTLFTGLNVDGGVNQSGGSLAIVGTGLVNGAITGAQTLSASGNGAGNGGTIFIETKGAGATGALNIDNVNKGFVLFAQSGLQGGHGGVVDIKAGGNLTVMPGVGLAAGPQGENGNGAILLLGSNGNLLIRDNLSANGAGTGAGGVIHLRHNGTATFIVSSSAPVTTAGVDGALSVLGGANSRLAGEIKIEYTSAGAGGLRWSEPYNTIGTGGRVQLLAPKSTITLSANIDVTNMVFGRNGGDILLSARTITIDPTTGVSLNVSGANGGNIQITQTGTTGTLNIGPMVPGQVEIIADGAVNGAMTGNGGTVIINTQGGINMPNGFSIDVGLAGRGGTLNISAKSNLTVDGNINLQAGTAGHGGSLQVSYGGTSILNVGNGATGSARLNGTLMVSGGSNSGNAGSIILNSAAGGMNLLSAADLNANAFFGNGATIGLNTSGVLNLTNAPLLTANGASGRGGAIAINAKSITMPALSNVRFAANGSHSFTGGAISLNLTTGNATLGNGAGQFSFSALGGQDAVSATHRANGGSVKVQLGSAGTLTVLPTAFDQVDDSSQSSQIELIAGKLVLAGTVNAGLGNSSSVRATVLGAGTLTQTGGLVRGTTVTLTAGTSALGTLAQRLRTEARQLSINTKSNVFIENSGDVSTGLILAGTEFSLSNLGVLTVNGSLTANKITLDGYTVRLSDDVVARAGGQVTVSTAGDIIQTAGVLNSPKTTLNGGSIGVLYRPLFMTTATAATPLSLQTTSTVGDTILTANRAVNMSASSSAGRYELTAWGNLKTGTLVTGDSAGLVVVDLVSPTGTITKSNLTIGSTISVPGNSLALVSGDGNITGSPVISAGLIVLRSRFGAIGPLNVDTPFLDVSSLGTVTLNAVSAGPTGITATFSKAVTLVAANGLNVSNIFLPDGSLNVSTKAGNINILNRTVSASKGITITNNDAAGGDIIMDSTFLISSGAVAFTAKSGSMTITDSNINGKSVALTSNALTGGGISLSFTDVIASSLGAVTVNTKSGALSLDSSEILGKSVTLNNTAATGGSFVMIGSNDIQASNTGAVLLSNKSGAMSVSGLIRGKTITIINNDTTGGGLTLSAPDIATLNGNLVITAKSGALNINANSLLHAQTGDIQINNTEKVAGTISIGASSQITTFATLATKGNIRIFIGTSAGAMVNSAPPVNVTNVLDPGGKIFYGVNSISASAPNNTVRAKGATVQFNTGTRPSSAITLGGDVFIFGDPVVPEGAPNAVRLMVKPAAEGSKAVVMNTSTGVPAMTTLPASAPSAVPSDVTRKVGLFQSQTTQLDQVDAEDMPHSMPGGGDEVTVDTGEIMIDTGDFTAESIDSSSNG